MRRLLQVQSVAIAVILILGVSLSLGACSIFPKDMPERVRWASKITLSAYETTQQGALIYGRLPNCDKEAGVVYLCRDPAVWAKIKQYDLAATSAIVKAQPVLNGTVFDQGEMAAAYDAILNVKAALTEAQTKLVTTKEPQP